MTGVLAAKPGDAGDVDSLRGERLHRGVPVARADRPGQVCRGARTSGRNRLVGTLAAVVARQRAACDRLAGPRQARQAQDEIEIDRADNDHPPGSPGFCVHGRSL